MNVTGTEPHRAPKGQAVTNVELTEADLYALQRIVGDFLERRCESPLDFGFALALKNALQNRAMSISVAHDW